MSRASVINEQQLRRQILWLKDSWAWLLQNKVMQEWAGHHKMTALDVGCGPGLVMEALGRYFDLKGLDQDEGMVKGCLVKDLDVVRGEAEDLPFEDGTFDMVYCSFLLLWTKDPHRVVQEMERVSRRWVVCLAEPDYGGRIDHPEGLSALREVLIDGLVQSGADPRMGRKLRSLFSDLHMDVEVGVHSGVWDPARLFIEGPEEWRNIAQISGRGPNDIGLLHLQEVWERALAEGTLFQYSPIFYAFGRK